MKVSLVLLIALAACALLRRRSAAVRHAVLASAIVCAASLPVLERVVPPLPVAVSGSSALQRITTALRSGVVASETPRQSHDPHGGAVTEAAGKRPASEPRGAAMLRWTWLAGTAASLLLLLIGLGRLAWLAARADPIVSGAWAEACADISREYGLSRPVALLCGADPGLLVTWGLIRPKIIVPASALQWNAARIRVVLCHELAHVTRRDWTVQVVAEFLRAAYWFNPLAWLACNRLRHESERAADDTVLLRGIEPQEYAAHLLDLARTMTAHRRAWAAAPAIARPSSLERRISAMLNRHLDRTPLSRTTRAVCAATVLAMTASVASLVFAQPPSARFSGSVSDPSGAPLPDTTISLTHKASGVTHASPTDQAGTFTFAALPPGEYLVEARAIGFASIANAMTLASGDSMQRDIRMNISSVQETITVARHAVPLTRPAKTAADVKRVVDRLRGQRLQPPLKVNDVRPAYPPSLREAGVDGQVVLSARIATDGSLTGFEVVTPAHPDLVTAALDAARQWRFEPTRLWGTPVEVGIRMTFNFTKG